MFNGNEEALGGEDNVVGEDGQYEEDLESGEQDEGGEEEPEFEVDGTPPWRQRRFLIMAGGLLAVVVVLVGVLVVVSGGDETENPVGGVGGDEIREIDFEVEEVEAGLATGDVESLGQAIAELDDAGRVALLQQLGISPEEAAEAGVVERRWGLNTDAAEVPTGLKPWEQYAFLTGGMSGGEGGGGMTLGLVAQDLLASLGPVVWPMVQADQTLRRIFTQSLVDWDYWGTQGDLLVLETYLDAAGEASLEAEKRLSEADTGVSAQTRRYVRDTLRGLEPLLRGRDIAVELNDSFADGRGWDTLEPSERSRLGRLAGQEIFEALSDFDRVMINYGCSVCGELYRNPPDDLPRSAAPAIVEGTADDRA